MSNSINFKKEINDEFERVIERVTARLKDSGFGILTRIDMHTKIESGIGKKIPKLAILGACNPTMAFEAVERNSDVSSLLPCNAVVREIGPNRMSVEIAKPSSLMKILGDSKLDELALKADELLAAALEKV